jgi:hypothetical protein
MREMARDLLDDAQVVRERIALHEPTRLPTAQLMFDDTFRAFTLIHSAGHLTARKRTEIAARLTRAIVVSEALNAQVQ